MKKILICSVAVLSLAACKKETLISNCEKFGNPAETGDYVVKCPVSEKLTKVQASEANAMFLPNYYGFNITDIANDTSSIYVNVVPNDCGEGKIGYRVAVQNPIFDGKHMYAVTYCEK